MHSSTKSILRRSTRSWLSLEQGAHQLLSQLLRFHISSISHRCKIKFVALTLVTYITIMISFYVQLSCASTSPVLSDRSRFRRYFQLQPSMVDIANGYIGVFRLYGWRHVTLIVQEENLFTEVNNLTMKIFR